MPDERSMSRDAASAGRGVVLEVEGGKCMLGHYQRDSSLWLGTEGRAHSRVMEPLALHCMITCSVYCLTAVAALLRGRHCSLEWRGRISRRTL